MIGGDWPKGEQTLSVPHGCTVSHRLFPPCEYVVSLGKEIIRFKPQKRRIKGGRGGNLEIKSGVLCRGGIGRGYCRQKGMQKGSSTEGKQIPNVLKEGEEQSTSGHRKD